MKTFLNPRQNSRRLVYPDQRYEQRVLLPRPGAYLGWFLAAVGVQWKAEGENMETTALPPGWVTGPLAEELRTFYAHKAELLETAKRRYVLIKGDDVVGLFDYQEEAFSEAYRRFRLSGFMIKQVQEHEEVITIGGSSFVFLDDEDRNAAS